LEWRSCSQPLSKHLLEPLRCWVVAWGGHEAARISWSAGWRAGIAAIDARAANGNGGDLGS
jgi:hypothetical protein